MFIRLGNIYKIYAGSVKSLPTFIISMSEARARPLVSVLVNLEFVDLKMIPGLRGQDYFNDGSIFDHKAFLHLNGRQPLAGEVGCAYSHYSVYKEIVKYEHEWSLILEDDSRINEFGTHKLKTLIHSILTDIQLFERPCVIHLKLENRPIVAKKFRISDEIESFECLTVLRETNAYLINIAAARVAVREGLPLRDVADWPHWISDVLFLAISEDIFSVDRNIASEIGTREDMYKNKNLFGTKLVFHKVCIFFGIVSGYEFCLYKKNTGLNDYYSWKIRYRLLKMAARIVGRRDSRQSNVVLIPWPSPKSWPN